MLFDSEIPPKEIFKKMKQNIFDNYYHNTYSHINREYITLRSSLFSLLHKVCEKMGFRSQTFFLCVQYLDIIFSKKQPNIPFSKYNTVGLACLCLSAKYCENDPIVPHLQYFVKVYNSLVRGGWKNTLTKNDLLSFEVLSIKLLNYKLHYYTIYEFDSFFWGFGIVKIEQLTDINYNGYSRSHSVKKVIERIYKKSREYLDIIINNWKVSMKFNSLMLSVYIMKKSVEEVLLDEKKFSEKDSKLKEDFIKKNSLYFQRIMSDFYKIEYEQSAQYKEIINDEEINKIFKYNEIINLSPAVACLDNQENKKNDKENKINENNKYNISLKFERNVNSNYNPSSTAVNFYKKNVDMNKNNIKENKGRIYKTKTIANLKKKIDINDDNNDINDNIIINNDKNDDIEENLNIDEITNFKSIETSKRSNQHNTFINNKLQKNSDINPRGAGDINKNFSKTFYKKLTITNSKSKVDIFSNKNYIKNDDNNKIIPKKTNNKTQKNSPQKLDTSVTSNPNSNLNDYSKINKFIKNRRAAQHSSSNLSNLTNNSNLVNYSCNIEENKIISKPYYKKFVHQNTDNIINTSNIINNNNSTFNNSGTNFYPSSSKKLTSFYKIGLHKQVDSNLSNKSNNFFNISKENENINKSIEINSTHHTARKYKKILNYNFTSNSLSNNNKVTCINKDASTFDNEKKQKPEIESYNKFKLAPTNSFINKTEKKQLNSERDFTNRRSYLILQKNIELNNKLKEINKAKCSKNNENDFKRFEKEDEKSIMNKTSDSWMNKKFTIKNFANIRDKYKCLKDRKNSNLTDIEIDDKDKDKDKINKNGNKNKNEGTNTNKVFYRNNKESLDYNNSSIKSSRTNFSNKNNNDDQPQSSFIKFLARTKTLFDKKEENKIKLNNKDSINKSNTYLFKKKTDYALNNKTFDESLPENKNTYYKNIIGKSKIVKEDQKSNIPQKNAAITKNNTNINVTSKISNNNNLNNDKNKNKALFKRINTNYNNNGLLNNKIKANINQNHQNNQSENGTFNSLLNRLSFYKKNESSSNTNVSTSDTKTNANLTNKKTVNSIRLRKNIFG